MLVKLKLIGLAFAGSSALYTALHFGAHGLVKLEDNLRLNFTTQARHLATEIAALAGASTPSPTPSQDSALAEASEAHRIDPVLVKALIQAESGGKPNAIRYEPHLARGGSDAARMEASSHGLMQVLARWAGHPLCPAVKTWADLYDPVKNIQCGTSILADSMRKTGSLRRALVAYNSGCLKAPCPPRSEEYAVRIMVQYAELKHF